MPLLALMMIIIGIVDHGAGETLRPGLLEIRQGAGRGLDGCRRSEQNSNMDARVPPRCALRLEDLRAWHVVRVSCRVCRHKGEIAAVALSRGLPGYTRLIDLEGRLRCRNCGARGRASLVVDLRPRD